MHERITNPRLLIVGQAANSTETVRAQLLGAGYQDIIAIEASNHAIGIIADELPDVVLIDMVTPETTGLDTLRDIRHDDRTSHLPCIMLTAPANHGMKKQAWRFGATDFLHKPIDPLELHARIRNAIYAGAREGHHDVGRTAESKDIGSSTTLGTSVAPDAPEARLAPLALSLDELFPTQLSWSALQQTCFQQLKSTAKVMIVDDDPITIMLVRECLVEEGYACVITSDDATNAIETIIDEEPDLVLLDVMMPGVSGLTILEKIRADERSMDLPVIILTASTIQSTKQRALNLGATEFLTKPIDPTEVLPRVRNALVVKAHQDHFKEYARELEREVSRQISKVRDYAAAMKKANQVLRRSQSAAQAANRAKSQFLANMSHEIRTPLTSMIGFADLVLDKSGSNGTLEQDVSHLEAISRNGKHLLEIVNDILDVSKIEAGQLEVELMPCSVCQTVTEVLQSTRVQAQTKGLSLQAEWATPVPVSIRSDPTCLRRILINLMGNAVKFTNQGSVRLIIRLLDHRGPEPKLQFDVVDTGIGFPKEQRDSLFQPFVQADASYRRRFGGTGLGLTISKQLVEKLGGAISVESEADIGSTFRVVVPTGPLDGIQLMENPCVQRVSDQENSPGNREPLEPSGLRCRILMAEDSVDCQRLITFILRKAGADVVVVNNGQVAYETLMESQELGTSFDLVLMDMQMPILDGYAATRKLRQAGFTRPIVALTAHAMSSDREKCLAAGCDDFASKPIDREGLLGLVRRYAGQRTGTAAAAGIS